MGGNMAQRLVAGGHRVVGWDRDVQVAQGRARVGVIPAGSLDELAARLARPRAVWMMVPAGAATEEATQALAARLEPGDLVIDGGNSFFKDDVRRARALSAQGIRHLDVGTSGGVLGLGAATASWWEGIARPSSAWSRFSVRSRRVVPPRPPRPAARRGGARRRGTCIAAPTGPVTS
jgi:6-phosphogluconate dehydrogenase